MAKTPAKVNGAPVLSLDTLDAPAHVRFGKRLYELLAPAALSLAQVRSLDRLQTRMAELWHKPNPTPADDDDLTAVLDQFCRLILKAPEAVHVALTDVQRTQVIAAFIALPGPVLPALGARGGGQAGRPTGARSFRASSGSTAATRSAG